MACFRKYFLTTLIKFWRKLSFWRKFLYVFWIKLPFVSILPFFEKLFKFIINIIYLPWQKFTNNFISGPFVMFNSGNKKLSTVTTKSRRTMHVCPYCSYSTNLLSNMRNHLRTHTGERPFVCKLCSKSFTQINSLKRHMIVHLSKDKLW